MHPVSTRSLSSGTNSIPETAVARATRVASTSAAWASAVACLDGLIVGVGDDETILAMAGPDTKVIDLAGRLALVALRLQLTESMVVAAA